MLTSSRVYLLILVACLLPLGCRGAASPSATEPPLAQAGQAGSSLGDQPEGRWLWGVYTVEVNADRTQWDIQPWRQADTHWNVLKWLEQKPCADCLSVVKITPSGTGTLLVDVQIKHPFSNANLTGFDVRGIAMFTGSHVFPVSGLNMPDRTMGDGELVNADGYTTLYNVSTLGSGPDGMQGYLKGKLASATPPNALLNGFKKFVSADPANTRNAFFAGDTVTATYEIDMPDGPFIFGYAVDACWASPINKPVNDPMTDFNLSANCSEAWKIDMKDLGPGLTPQSATTKLQIDVYDWQGKDDAHPVLVECPELFDGDIGATWESDGDGYTRYEAVIKNTKVAAPGDYPCLMSKEAQENDPSGKPWLELTACQVFTVAVGWPPGYPIDVTPPWLNFSPVDVCVDGNYAYIAGGLNGLHIFDISDPANPVWVNRVATPNEALAVAVSGSYAYVADGASGLQIIDIEPPESAYIVKSVSADTYAVGVAVSGGYAYVVNGLSGLQIIDIEPPESAYLEKSVDTPGAAYGVAVSGGYAYVADYNAGFQVIDIDPFESACIVNTVDTPGYAKGVAVSGGYAYVAESGSEGPYDWSELQIIDINPPESANVVKSVDTPGGSSGVAVSGGYAYVVNGLSGLQIIDIEPPESAYIVNSVDTAGVASGIAVSAGYAYVADDASGLQIIDIDPPESAYIVKSVDTPDPALGVAVSGAYAYVAKGSYDWLELKIIDIEPPESAYIVKSVDTCEKVAGVQQVALAVSGGYAYVTAFHKQTQTSGLYIIDIDPPESAYIVNSVDTPDYVNGVAVSGGYAYVADGASGLQIIDIDPPESAHIVKSVNTPGYSVGVAVSGGYAYVGDLTSGLQIIDIDPPESAFIRNTVDTPDQTRGVAVSGGYASVAESSTDFSGLRIIDIDPPGPAYIVKTVGTPGYAKEVALSEGYAYVADLTSGLQIIDVDPPESAYIVKSVDTLDDAVGVAISAGYVYVAASSGGLRIIRLW